MFYIFLILAKNLLSVGQMLEKCYSLLFKDRKCIIFYSYSVELFCVKMNKTFAADWEKELSRLIQVFQR